MSSVGRINYNVSVRYPLTNEENHNKDNIRMSTREEALNKILNKDLGKEKGESLYRVNRAIKFFFENLENFYRKNNFTPKEIQYLLKNLLKASSCILDTVQAANDNDKDVMKSMNFERNSITDELVDFLLDKEDLRRDLEILAIRKNPNLDKRLNYFRGNTNSIKIVMKNIERNINHLTDSLNQSNKVYQQTTKYQPLIYRPMKMTEYENNYNEFVSGKSDNHYNNIIARAGDTIRSIINEKELNTNIQNNFLAEIGRVGKQILNISIQQGKLSVDKVRLDKLELEKNKLNCNLDFFKIFMNNGTNSKLEIIELFSYLGKYMTLTPEQIRHSSENYNELYSFLSIIKIFGNLGYKFSENPFDESVIANPFDDSNSEDSFLNDGSINIKVSDPTENSLLNEDLNGNINLDNDSDYMNELNSLQDIFIAFNINYFKVPIINNSKEFSRINRILYKFNNQMFSKINESRNIKEIGDKLKNIKKEFKYIEKVVERAVVSKNPFDRTEDKKYENINHLSVIEENEITEDGSVEENEITEDGIEITEDGIVDDGTSNNTSGTYLTPETYIDRRFLNDYN